MVAIPDTHSLDQTMVWPAVSELEAHWIDNAKDSYRVCKVIIDFVELTFEKVSPVGAAMVAHVRISCTLPGGVARVTTNVVAAQDALVLGIN
jgi:hypothetical protein